MNCRKRHFFQYSKVASIVPSSPRQGETPATFSENPLPESWLREVTPQLLAGEQIVAWFLRDLDSGLSFRDELIVLTDKRVLATDCSAAASPSAAARPWK